METRKNQIIIQNCSIQEQNISVVQPFTWKMKEGETWLVTGLNGCGKSSFISALDNVKSKKAKFVPKKEEGLYFNQFENSTVVVSLEAAAALIAEERKNDDGDYIEGGIDIGRTARKYLSEILDSTFDVETLDTCKEVSLCGIAPILDRGLKYLSTGEIRRVLLCRALLSKNKLLVLSDPFAGLDKESRLILRNFFSSIVKEKKESPVIILSMERFTEIPEGITNVLEFDNNEISFCGLIDEYSDIAEKRKIEQEKKAIKEKEEVSHIYSDFKTERNLYDGNIADSNTKNKEELVRMNAVTVGWGDKTVLKNLSWTLYSGEHWLIRGPNGSGKTTFLELITGDNMQVFCNDVSIFGRRRGTGETIWELKEKMGIVSYRIHLEYRMVGDTDLEAVMLSGLHDSIGLYQQRSQVEQIAVNKWLKFGGFEGREKEPFSSLSYGEQRAVLILRAAVKCPSLLILDEPCHGLDDIHRTRVLNLLESIASTGSTTLLHVTHDPTEVLLCEKHILELLPNQEPMYKIILND